MLASLVKTRFMQASILSELRDEQVTRHAMDSRRGSFDSVDRFLKISWNTVLRTYLFLFSYWERVICFTVKRTVYSIYVSTCFNTAWISGKKLWRKLFVTNTFRPVTYQLRYTWWLAFGKVGNGQDVSVGNCGVYSRMQPKSSGWFSWFSRGPAHPDQPKIRGDPASKIIFLSPAGFSVAKNYEGAWAPPLIHQWKASHLLERTEVSF